MSMYTHKKSQTEIIGLVFIVILLIIGILYVISKKTKTDNKFDLEDAYLAQSFLNVMLHATTDCGQDLLKVIEDCFGRNDMCGNSCEYATDQINKILEGSLEQWGKPYLFNAIKQSKSKIKISSDCSKLSEKSSSGLVFIPDNSETIVVSLDICKI